MRGLAAAAILISACSNVVGEVTDSSTSAVTTTAPSIAPPEPGTPGVVASRYGVMGWYEKETEEWITPETTGEIPVFGGEEYQVVSLDQPITTAIGGGATLCEPSQTPVIIFDPQLPGSDLQPGAIAVLALWDLRPRRVLVGGDVAPEHRQALIDVVDSLGIEDPDPPVTQVISTDLDDDAAEELLLVAKRVPNDLLGRPGNYSVVVLRKQIEGEWQTAVLETSTGVADNVYVVSHTIPAVADLNGDGKMEVVVNGHYYEGAGSAAYEYIDDDLGPVAVLSGGCGA